MANLFSMKGEIVKEVDLPEVFNHPIRSDLIIQFFNAYMSNSRVPYGSFYYAGNRRVGHNLGPNHGISRYPRVSGSTRGVLLSNARGGRSAHHPVTAKNWHIKMNENQRKMAKFSALASVANIEVVRKRGHRFEASSLPIIVENEFENIKETSRVVELFTKIGVYEDIIRAKEGTKIRAGRGKSRGRKYTTPKSILIVVKSKDTVEKAVRNLPGVDVARPEDLNAYILAPGGHPGRLVVMSESALEAIRGWQI